MRKKLFFLLMLGFICVPLTANESSKLVISQKSQQEVYKSKLECKSSFNTGNFQSCWLSLFHSDQPVENVEIFIDGEMPAHEHGLPTSPKVVWSEDRKVYLIHGLKFSMPGKWTLNFKVNAKEAMMKDQVTIQLEVD